MTQQSPLLASALSPYFKLTLLLEEDCGRKGEGKSVVLVAA